MCLCIYICIKVMGKSHIFQFHLSLSLFLLWFFTSSKGAELNGAIAQALRKMYCWQRFLQGGHSDSNVLGIWCKGLSSWEFWELIPENQAWHSFLSPNLYTQGRVVVVWVSLGSCWGYRGYWCLSEGSSSFQHLNRRVGPLDLSDTSV